jgi:ribosomal peptide maturation radical SAM protein 1
VLRSQAVNDRNPTRGRSDNQSAGIRTAFLMDLTIRNSILWSRIPQSNAQLANAIARTLASGTNYSQSSRPLGDEFSVDIIFAVLPFSDLGRPALGVSLLDAHLQRRSISSLIRYFNLDLAERIGTRLYGWFSQCTADQELLSAVAPSEYLAGEWFFADLVFPGRIPNEGEYISRFFEPHPGMRKLIPEILEARRHREEFVDNCVREIGRHNPRVVGFTTTFHQTCACLAVAQRLKQTANPPFVMFGGANCEGVMGLELITSFPWIDFLCTGEGDEVVPEFLDQLLLGRDLRPVPGILKKGDAPSLTTPPPVREMDALPVPNYAAYFEALSTSAIGTSIQPRLLIETARGCWWGEKQHCTFCGLNGQTMGYRSKSPQRAFDELTYLSKSYGINQIEFVDNILDLKYVDSLFPELVRASSTMEFFLETKSNMRFDQLKTLRQGGVRAIQPGIESFSNQVLQLMRKGCNGLQNIQLLRWCEELGITVFWNLLYGFPGESPAEYTRMAELIPQLTHLQRPGYCGRIHVDRFSPLFTNRQLGIPEPRPASAYSYLYPLDPKQLGNLAYFFEPDYPESRDPAAYVGGLAQEVDRWPEWNSEKRPRLDLFQMDSIFLITDTRQCALKPSSILTGVGAKLYLACDTAQTPGSAARKIGNVVSPADAQDLMITFRDARLMAEMDGHFLSLAVWRNRSARDPAPKQKLAQIPQEARSMLNVI